MKTLVVRNSGDVEDHSVLGTPPEIRLPIPIPLSSLMNVIYDGSVREWFTTAKPFTYEKDVVVVYIEESHAGNR